MGRAGVEEQDATAHPGGSQGLGVPANPLDARAIGEGRGNRMSRDDAYAWG